MSLNFTEAVLSIPRYLPMFTVVPVKRLSVNVCPAGTVKVPRLTVVQATALVTSEEVCFSLRKDRHWTLLWWLPLTELIVPTQLEFVAIISGVSWRISPKADKAENVVVVVRMTFKFV